MLGNDTEMFDTSQLSPIFCGYVYEKVGPSVKSVNNDSVRVDNEEDTNLSGGDEKKLQSEQSFMNYIDVFEPDRTHIACYGFTLTKKSDSKHEERKTQRVATAEKVESVKNLPAREYLENEIFPVLMPALEAMLASAKENNVLRWKRTKFNACDYLTEYLYNNNPNCTGKDRIDLWEIPFVKRINGIKPRPPLPLSLLWSEDEAAIVLQSCWRGRKVRSDPEVQELRQYQKEMREQEYDIMLKIEDFWRKHPVEEASETATDQGVV